VQKLFGRNSGKIAVHMEGFRTQDENINGGGGENASCFLFCGASCLEYNNLGSGRWNSSFQYSYVCSLRGLEWGQRESVSPQDLYGKFRGGKSPLKTVGEKRSGGGYFPEVFTSNQVYPSEGDGKKKGQTLSPVLSQNLSSALKGSDLNKYSNIL